MCAVDVAAVGDVAVVRLSGELDVADCPVLGRRLRGAGPAVVVDLTEVTLMPATALGVLIAHTERLAANGGRLVVKPGNPAVRRLLSMTGADQVLDLRLDAIPSLPVPGTRKAPAERQNTRGDVLSHVRRRLRTQPTIARALGVLQERYGLSGEQQAFDVFGSSSQRHNLRLYTLATAFLAAQAPRRRYGRHWFPGRFRAASPRLRFTTEVTSRERNRTVVLDAVLDAVAACTHSEVVGVSVLEVGVRAPVLARHRGLTSEVVEFIDDETRLSAVVGEVLRRRSRVVVTDVAADPVLTDPAERMVLLGSGCRALQCSPLTTTGGAVVGMVFSHDPRPGRLLTPAQHARLDEITSDAGAWLDWHRRTVVLDALEDVHRAGRMIADTGDRR